MRNLKTLLPGLPTATQGSEPTSPPPEALPECPVCLAHGKYLDLRHPPPACATCHDAGWVQERRPNRESASRPRLVAVRCPDCAASDRIEELWARSGIAEAQRWAWQFATFDLGRNPAMSVALAAARAWGRAAPGTPPFLLLSGAVGVGKSHLAVAAAGERLAAGQRVVYEQTTRWLDALRATQRPARDGDDPPPDVAALRGAAEGADAFVLDDLGAQRNTEFAAEQILAAINLRWERSLPTLITTNDDPTAYPDRLRSRLLDRRAGVVVLCSGRDLRLEA